MYYYGPKAYIVKVRLQFYPLQIRLESYLIFLLTTQAFSAIFKSSLQFYNNCICDDLTIAVRCIALVYIPTPKSKKRVDKP